MVEVERLKGWVAKLEHIERLAEGDAARCDMYAVMERTQQFGAVMNEISTLLKSEGVTSAGVPVGIVKEFKGQIMAIRGTFNSMVVSTISENCGCQDK